MREAVEQGRCHLGIAEDGRPFAEGQVRRDDNERALVELADQVEQQLAACLSKWKISQFFEYDEVETGQVFGRAPLFSAAALGIEPVHQIDHVEEAASGAVPYQGASDRDGEM